MDDKTIREAQKSELSLIEFTAGWTERFHQDAKQLNMLDPHLEPSAVQHIPEQVQLIEKLIENGNAYPSGDGSVYFSVKSYSNYGKLTRIDQRDLMAGAGETANDADEYEKDNVCDFVLWKARKPEDGDNYWDSPWGSGRPGWHLECSAMGMKYLGETFDLHAGGVDLCFPHHEIEIAQSEASTGKELARHWFHNEHLMVDGSKMSKSLGNLYTLADIHDRDFSAAELRYSLLSGSYRTKINFSFDRMNEARINLKRIANLVQNLGSDLPSYEELCESAISESMDLGPFESSWDALLEDLNAPAALGELFVAIKPLEKELAEGNVPEDTKKVALHGLALLVHAFGWILPELETKQSSPDVPDHVKDLAERRWIAKQEKDWAESDRLRDAVVDEGWVIKDSKDGYELEPS